MSWGEKESRHRQIFFLVFCYSSDVLVRWFRLHSCASGVRPLFGAQSKMGATTFDYLRPGKCSLLSLPRHASLLTNFQTQVVLFLSSAQKIFKSYLITVVIHRWLADLQRALWPDFSGVSKPFRRLSVSFLFLLFFFSLSLSFFRN